LDFVVHVQNFFDVEIQLDFSADSLLRSTAVGGVLTRLGENRRDTSHGLLGNAMSFETMILHLMV